MDNEEMKNPDGGAGALQELGKDTQGPSACQSKIIDISEARGDLTKSIEELTSFLERREAETLQENIQTHSISDIMKMKFDPIKWLVPDVLTEGVSLLAAPPKSGKSFMGLDLAASISMGGVTLGKKVEQRCTLYVALEDSLRRIQSRVSKQFCFENKFPDLCQIVTQWPTGADGLMYLHNFALQNPEMKLAIIDTLGRFSSMRDSNDYIETTKMLATLKEIAEEGGFSILLIHHTKKLDTTDDFVNRVLGSTGIIGGVDNIILLNRKRGEHCGILSVAGRDIEEKEYGVNFDPVTCRWDIVGDAAEVTESKERHEIVENLRTAGSSMTAREIAGILQ
jgi:RecA-family ATPase